MINRPDVLALFASQSWVATTQQLSSLGVPPSALTRARRHGLVTTVVPGVVRVAGSPETFGARAMALQLHAGDDSFLSGFTAGALHGLREMPRRVLEVTVPEDQQYVMPPWARLVRTSWIDHDRDIVHRADGLRVASPLRMLFRLAKVFNEHRFERAAEDCWHLGLLTPESAEDYLAAVRRRGRTGVARFERWLERTVTRARPSQSGLELDVLEALRRAGLPEPERQYPLTLRGGEVIHVDFAWPRARLGVEPGHLWWHGGDDGVERDEARRRACDEVGWRIVACTERVREDLAAFGLQVRIIFDERLRSLRPARSP